MRSKFDEQLLELNKEMIEMGNIIILSIKKRWWHVMKIWPRQLWKVMQR